MPSIRAIDLFCGAGGSSWGAKNAGVEIVAGFDMWPVSGRVYQDNFKSAKFFLGKLEEFNPWEVREELGKIDLILASPECTNHSPVKGNKHRCDISKNTAFQVVKFAHTFNPRWIVIENVINMKKWNRFQEFLGEIEALGYKIQDQVLNASDFGVPQNRRRLFILCDKVMQPHFVQPSKAEIKNAASVINRNGVYPYSPLHKEKRARATLERANRAMAQLGENVPFLIVYYGSDYSGGWQSLDKRLRTITTLDRFAIV